jgi:hypothetical protein
MATYTHEEAKTLLREKGHLITESYVEGDFEEDGYCYETETYLGYRPASAYKGLEDFEFVVFKKTDSYPNYPNGPVRILFKCGSEEEAIQYILNQYITDWQS